MTEVWKPIEGYEGIYEVSSLGRVRSLDRMTICEGMDRDFIRHAKGRILTPVNKGYTGYKGLILYKDGKGKNVYIHRLVAETFLPNPNNLLEVNHKNEDKSDNRAENLEWCDRLYNIHYGTGRQRHDDNMYTTKAVIQMTLDGEFVAEHKSIREAARATGARRDGIRCCCMKLRKYNTAKGYKWKFKDE